MSANLFEKIIITSSLGISLVFFGAMYFKKPKLQKDDAFKIRQQLLKQDDIKMLYSTMSFFYLQGFKQRSIESFYSMHKILQMETPNLIVLPISKEQYEANYLKVLQHPKFRPSMDKFIHSLETKDTSAIESMTDFELSNLQKLYLIDYCNKLKKCKIVYAQKSKQYYRNLAQSIRKLKNDNKAAKENPQIIQTLDNVKVENYTDSLLKEIKPKVAFSIFPQSPFKMIYGIIQPELLKPAAIKWKQKFFQNYNHQVIEDQAVVERERSFKQSLQKGGLPH